MVETRVPAVYLKMTGITPQKVVDSFSKGTFQLLLTCLDTIYTREQVACRS